MTEGWNISKKTVLVTGGTGGIGKAVVRALERQGAQVVILARDLTKVRGKGIVCDLASLASIQEAVTTYKKQFDRLDVLINIAGVMPIGQEFSKDGIELNRAVNYFAPVLLTELLLPLMRESVPARIINVTSSLYKRGVVDLEDLKGQGEYNRYQAYGTSKLWLMLYTRALAERLRGTGITVNAVHPGWIRTKLAIGALKKSGFLARTIFPLFNMRPAWWGARTIVYLAKAQEASTISGEYFISKKIAATKPIAKDLSIAEPLVTKTLELLSPYLS